MNNSIDYNFVYTKISPSLEKVLRFILIQDPIKIATGFTLGYFTNNLISKMLNNIVKPIVYMVISLFSKSGFIFTVLGQSINIGAVLSEIILFTTFIFILYYGFVSPIDNLKERYNIDQKIVHCPYCKTLIDPDATRCPSCTSELNKPI